MEGRFKNESYWWEINMLTCQENANIFILNKTIDGETIETMTDFIFLGSKITVDGDCSHENKRHLLLGRKAMTSLSSVQFSCSVVSDSFRPHGLQHTRPPCPSPLPKLAQTHVHWVGDAMDPSHPLSSPSPPAFNLSQHQGLFQGVSSSHQMAKGLEFQLWHQSFQCIFRIISFRIARLDLTAVQGAFRSFEQQHSSEASILQHSAFFMVQLSHPYTTTGKNIALTRQPFVGKVMSLLLIN